MKSSPVAAAYKALSLALFALSPAHGAVDLFPLSQCECGTGSFAPLTGNILGDMTRGGSSCSGSGSFPDDTGFSASTSFTNTATVEFLSATQSLTNTIFVAEFDTTAPTSGTATSSLMIFGDDGDDLITFQIAGTGGSATSSLGFNGDTTGFTSLYTPANAEPVFAAYGQTSTLLFACQARVSALSSMECVTKTLASTTASTTASEILLNARIVGSGFNLFVRRFAAFSGIDFTSGTDAASIATIVKAQIGTLGNRVSIPTVSTTTDSGLEDNPKNFDFTDYLTGGKNFGTLEFTFGFGDNADRISNENGGTFTFTPVTNSFGTFDFDFDYGISTPYECSNSATLAYTVTPVNDAPVAIAVADQVAKAGITIDYEISVATDVDEDGSGDPLPLSTGTMSGIALSPSSFATIKAAGCSGSAITSLDIVDGKVSFCLDVAVTSDSGTSATMSYTVSDGSLTDTGSFVINGGSPATGKDFTFQTNEDANKSITFNANMVDVSSEVSTSDVDFEVKTLPGHGIIRSGNTVLTVGSAIAFGATIVYAPDANYFNSDADSQGGLDAAGNFFDSSCSVTRINNACPDVFTVITRVGGANGVKDDPSSIFAQVLALNDNGPTITATANVEAVASKASNGEIQSKLEGVTITNDNGSQAFNVVVQLSTTGDATFQFNIANVVVDGTDDNGIDCARETCTDATITGIPSQIMKLLNSQTAVFVPVDATGIVSVQIDVLNPNDNNVVLASAKVTYSVVDDPSTFFDDPKNAAIVAGGGCLVLVGLIGFGIYRSTRASKIDRDNALIMAESVVVKDRNQDKPQQKRRGKTTETADNNSRKSAPIHDGKKSLKIDANDAIFDWEKHIDEETGEAYFFNPTTGATSWDPPTVKKYQI